MVSRVRFDFLFCVILLVLQIQTESAYMYEVLRTSLYFVCHTKVSLRSLEEISRFFDSAFGMTRALSTHPLFHRSLLYTFNRYFKRLYWAHVRCRRTAPCCTSPKFNRSRRISVSIPGSSWRLSCERWCERTGDTQTLWSPWRVI